MARCPASRPFTGGPPGGAAPGRGPARGTRPARVVRGTGAAVAPLVIGYLTNRPDQRLAGPGRIPHRRRQRAARSADLPRADPGAAAAALHLSADRGGVRRPAGHDAPGRPRSWSGWRSSMCRSRSRSGTPFGRCLPAPVGTRLSHTLPFSRYAPTCSRYGTRCGSARSTSCSSHCASPTARQYHRDGHAARSSA